MRTQIAEVSALPVEQLATYAKDIGAPLDLVKLVAKTKQLPVVNFAAGGIATRDRVLNLVYHFGIGHTRV